MQLPAAHRREVIEDLLDIRVFSTMNGIVRDKIRSIRDDIKMLEVKKSSLKDKVKMQQSFIDEITKRGESTIESKREETKKAMFEKLELEKKVVIELDSIEQLQKQLDEFQSAGSKLKKLGGLRGKIQQKISTLTKNHKFFSENAVCPTCTQEINEDLKGEKLDELGAEAKKLKEGFDDLEKAIKAEEEREEKFTTISKTLTESNRFVSNNNVQINGLMKQIESYEKEIEEIRHQIENQSEESEKLEAFTSNLASVTSDTSDKNLEISKHQFVYDLLKDGGVKTNIIRKYIPLINKHVNKYLQMMEFYINFNLDEEFNETVVSPIHENFSYSSFSEGEKMRIDLALLFTWGEVARVRNSVNTNLLIMDEVFDSSLDGFGTEEFLKIIRYVVKDANIFIISHKQELHERFDSVLRFEKEKGFSKLSSK
jgi:DNA repair exonuclease SbcCD ATPase subunit